MHRALRIAVGLGLLAFLAAFYFHPLFSILRLSLAPDGRLEAAAAVEVLSEAYVWRLVGFTTWQATLSTALTLALGLPVAYVFARYDFPGKQTLRAVTAVPFVLPTVVVAAAFLALLGNGGVINRWLQAALQLEAGPLRLERTLWIVLLAHAFYNLGVVVRTVGGFWSNMGSELEEAAAVLGAGPWRRFSHVTLPLLLPSIAAASLLVFLFCFTSFGVMLILGGLRYSTLETEIYRQTIAFFDLPAAAVLALLQLVITFGVMVAYTRLQARTSVTLALQPSRHTSRPPAGIWRRLMVAAVVIALSAFVLTPLLTLAWRSLTLGGEMTLVYYRELGVNRLGSAFFVPPGEAVWNSLRFALTATGLSLALGVTGAYMVAGRRSGWRTLLDPILLLPLGTSAVTLGLGYVVAMGNLRASTALIPAAHTLIAMPFVVRAILPALRGLDQRLRDAAAVLGAGPVRAWRQVDLPILWPAVVVGAAFAFTISMGEFGATLLISRPETQTMPVVIYRALSRPGQLNYGQALAMSTILMAVCAAAIVIIERFRFRDIGEF
ncbi:MAG: ABC transporter permease [Anaerolineae bacterium]